MSFTDPLGLCADPGGTGTRYCIDAFIPQPFALFGLKGDNRGLNPNGGSYRLRYLILNGETGTVSRVKIGISEFWFGLPKKGYIMAPCYTTISELPQGGRKIRARCGGSVGHFGGAAPPFEFDFKIYETPDGTFLKGTYTDFPSFEVWQYGNGAPRLLKHLDASGSRGLGLELLLNQLF